MAARDMAVRRRLLSGPTRDLVAVHQDRCFL
jgi:hypothetical protein